MLRLRLGVSVSVSAGAGRRGFKTVMELVEDARSEVEELSVEELEAKLASVSPSSGCDETSGCDESSGSGFRLIDIRDVRELERTGVIPGATHVPRGMLEFWLCESSKYWRGFDRSDSLVLYCGSGWRSALAARVLTSDLGFPHVAHLEPGITGWIKANKPLQPHP